MRARHLGILVTCAALAAPLLLLAPSGAFAVDPGRGRALYDSRCGGCHTQSVHGRVKRVARDFEDVRRWVARWNDTLRLNWSPDEVEDVAAHLNTAYYGYACPPSVCKVVSRN
jgi:mono/diheme cytochrome c family protein